MARLRAVTDTAPLDAEQLEVYFALMEVSSLLQHAVELQLRADGGLSWVQFQILAGLNDLPGGCQRMTDIADRVVYSRSGLTYQATQLEKEGLITRTPDVDDERSTNVAISDDGRALVRRVLPGHVAIVRETLLQHLKHRDTATLTNVLGKVRDRMRSAPPRSAAPRTTGSSARSGRNRRVKP
jgi:DNA-binding MarR family transcriptional regulator